MTGSGDWPCQLSCQSMLVWSFSLVDGCESLFALGRARQGICIRISRHVHCGALACRHCPVSQRAGNTIDSLHLRKVSNGSHRKSKVHEVKFKKALTWCPSAPPKRTSSAQRCLVCCVLHAAKNLRRETIRHTVHNISSRKPVEGQFYYIYQSSSSSSLLSLCLPGDAAAPCALG